MALPALLANLATLRGAAAGIMPAGMSLGAGVGQLGAAAAAGAPALSSSLSVAPASAAPSAAPAAGAAGEAGALSAPSSFSLPPHLESGGGAHGGGQAPSTPSAPITPGGAGTIGWRGLTSLSAAPAPSAFSSGSSDRTANINPYIGSTGGANANIDRSMSPYAPGISEGAGNYYQNPAELPGPTTMDDLINSLPGAPTGTSPDYNPGYFNSPGSPQRVADNSGGVYGNSAGGASALSATGYPGGFPTGTLTPTDSYDAPFMGAGKAAPGFSGATRNRLNYGGAGPAAPGGPMPGQSYSLPPSLQGTGSSHGYDPLTSIQAPRAPAQGPEFSGVTRERANAAGAVRPGAAGTPTQNYQVPGAAGTPAGTYRSVTSGTGGANRGTEPDLYGGVFSPSDLGLGGVSPAAAAPAPAAPAVNPFASIGDFFSPPSQQAVDLMAGGYGVAPPVASTPGFLEAGGASKAPAYGTPRPPQPRPAGGPPDSYKFLGNMPQPRPDPFSPDYQPYVRRGSGWSPYEEGFTPPLPRARPEYINPFGYYFGE